MEAQHGRRPIGTALATAVLATIGLAGILTGPYLVVLGAWLAERYAGDTAMLIQATETIAGVGAFAAGIIAFATARGLWRGEAWAWPAAMFLAVALLSSAALIALLDVWSAPYLLVVAVAALLAGSLVPASVRRAYGL